MVEAAFYLSKAAVSIENEQRSEVTVCVLAGAQGRAGVFTLWRQLHAVGFFRGRSGEVRNQGDFGRNRLELVGYQPLLRNLGSHDGWTRCGRETARRRECVLNRRKTLLLALLVCRGGAAPYEERIDQLFQLGASTFDFDRVFEYYREFQIVFATEDLGLIYTDSPGNPFAVYDRFGNAKLFTLAGEYEGYGVIEFIYKLGDKS